MQSKLAQRRSLRSKLWENVNLTGKAVEEMNPEVREVMDKMRSVDEEIRQTADNIKSIVRTAKYALRTRDYLGAAYSLSEFHARSKYIAHLLSSFAKNVDLKHYKYLLEQFEDPYKSELFNYNPTEEIKNAAENFNQLVKEAGPVEWMKDKFLAGYDAAAGTGSNLITDKGRARKMMEKRFSTSFIKELQSKTSSLVSKAETLLRQLLATFSALESGVSRRNISHYVSNALKFSDQYFKTFHTSFVEYYGKVIEPLKLQQAKMIEEQENAKKEIEDKKIQEEIKKREQEHEEYGQKILDDAKRMEEAYGRANPPKVVRDTDLPFEEWKKEKTENKPEVVQVPAEESSEALEKLKNKRGPEGYFMSPELYDQLNEEEPEENTIEEINGEQKAASIFLNKIIVLAQNENTKELFEEIIDYSAKIEDTQPEESQALLNLAQQMIQDKQAGIFDFLQKKKTEPTQNPEVKLKPSELTEQDTTKYKIKKLDLPDGKIDQAFSDISALRSVSVSNIRVSPEAARLVIATIAKRLAKLTDTEDMSPFAEALETKLIPVLKEAIHSGWVIGASSVSDGFNPHDKYLEIYVRLDLGKVHSDLGGIAKMRVAARLSADQGVLMVRAVQRNFDVEVPQNEIEQMKEEFNEEEEMDEQLEDQRDTFDNEGYLIP